MFLWPENHDNLFIGKGLFTLFSCKCVVGHEKSGWDGVAGDVSECRV